MTPDVLWARFLLKEVDIAKADRFPPAADFEAGMTQLMGNLACVSCGAEVIYGSPYCSYFCKDLSKAVRAARKAYSTDQVDDADFQLNIGSKLISIFKGGYPSRERTLTKRERAAIFERDQGRCQLCDEPATEIDHINGDSRDPSNLRAVCGPCNRALAMTVTETWSPEEIEDSTELAVKVCVQMATRIAAPEPLYICDNHERWQKVEPKIRARRRKHFARTRADVHDADDSDLDDDEFEGVDGYLYHSMQKDD